MPTVKTILSQISGNSERVSSHYQFVDWVKPLRVIEGDGVIVNNSFLFREQIKTPKSELYLLYEVVRGGRLSALPSIVRGVDTNSDFRLVRKQDMRGLTVLPLPEGIEHQLEELGSLPRVLIGRVRDDVIVQTQLSHRTFHEVILDPSSVPLVVARNGTITVRDTFDAEGLWAEFEVGLARDGLLVDDLEALKVAFNASLDRLEEMTYARLVFPDTKGRTDESVLLAVCTVLQEQRNEYETALRACGGDPDRDSGAYNQILRISYNFASDVAGLVRLITSISDLKPVLLWMSLARQFELSCAFRKLPWLRSRTKPSLDNYLGTVGDARNSAFHHLFPFRKTLEVALPSEAIVGITLRMFAEFRRKDNQLRYRDKELVEVLTEFTRAGRRRVPPHFWRQNLEVMDATVALFRRTEEVLDVLYS